MGVSNKHGHMIECEEGDFFKVKLEPTENGLVDTVFRADRPWKYNPDSKYNGLAGTNIYSNKSEVIIVERNYCILLSKEEQELLEKKMEESSQEIIRQDEKIIQQVVESLECIYKDNWDLQVNPNNPLSLYTVIIKFPSFYIVNGRNERHEIKDLYVRFKFKKGFVLSCPIEGTRGTLSFVEYESRYLHSHLPRLNIRSKEDLKDTIVQATSFNTFCLGVGDFADINSEWKCEDKVFNQEEFELLLYQLQAYVQWESLGGGPYISIRDISVRDCNWRGHIHGSGRKEAFESIIANIKNFPLKFNHLRSKFEIDFSELESFISPLESPHLPKIKKTSEGEYIYGQLTPLTINRRVDDANEIYKSVSLFKFQGEDISLKITGINTEDEDDHLEEVIHPDITRHIATELEKKVNNNVIKKQLRNELQ